MKSSASCSGLLAKTEQISCVRKTRFSRVMKEFTTVGQYYDLVNPIMMDRKNLNVCDPRSAPYNSVRNIG